MENNYYPDEIANVLYKLALDMDKSDYEDNEEYDSLRAES